MHMVAHFVVHTDPFSPLNYGAVRNTTHGRGQGVVQYLTLLAVVCRRNALAELPEHLGVVIECRRNGLDSLLHHCPFRSRAAHHASQSAARSYGSTAPIPLSDPGITAAASSSASMGPSRLAASLTCASQRSNSAAGSS